MIKHRMPMTRFKLIEPTNNTRSIYMDKISKQNSGSIFSKLPDSIIASILEHVDQLDLVNLMLTCSNFYDIATDRLYRRVTIAIGSELPVEYNNETRIFIQKNGFTYMNSSLIFSIKNLLKFLESLHHNPYLLNKIKFFIFDKCTAEDTIDLDLLQTEIIDFFGENSTEINFLHITFVDYITGITKLKNFLLRDNIRNRIFKLFVTKAKDLYEPRTPPNLTNLFLMLDEEELMNFDGFDLSKPPFEALNNLRSLTSSSKIQFGLQILENIKLYDDMKIKLKGLTLFHCHREDLYNDENDFILDLDPNTMSQDLKAYLKNHDMRLNFKTISSKIDLTTLRHLFLKIDCFVSRNGTCNCYKKFFEDFTIYSQKHDGLPKLTSLEVESFPYMEWLRPTELLDRVFAPIGNFLKSLSNMTRLKLDFAAPTFKTFYSIEMNSFLMNELNRKIMEAFFFDYFPPSTCLNLKSVELADFLTSFIYYKPDFYQSLLHTCQCWGCNIVLEKLKEEFCSVLVEEQEELDEDSTLYFLIRFLLTKVQGDREICIPIKEMAYDYTKYPIFKGEPHALHNQCHGKSRDCKCFDDAEINIDDLTTTYVIHQLEPIVRYLVGIFGELDILMIHGIYYHYDKDLAKYMPIFDEYDYPEKFLRDNMDDINTISIPNVEYGYFLST